MSNLDSVVLWLVRKYEGTTKKKSEHEGVRLHMDSSIWRQKCYPLMPTLKEFDWLQWQISSLTFILLSFIRQNGSALNDESPFPLKKQ